MNALAMDAVRYFVYGVEFSLVVVLALKGRWRRQKCLAVYVFALFCSDAIIRPAVLYEFGWQSAAYRYAYWYSDALLVLGTFFLIFQFFKRACQAKPDLWPTVRLGLGVVFFIVAVISLLFLSNSRSDLFTSFVSGFQQNLYFVCLVLNTFLYITVQQMERIDDDLGLLVCGLGIQFAGPAAAFALIHLTPGNSISIVLANYVASMCTLGMLLAWLYAITRTPRARAVLRSASRMGMPDRMGVALQATK